MPPHHVIPNQNFYDWLYRACTFLVVSCPCALVLSIPLTFFSGIGFASKNGVLIKGSNYLEALRYVDTVVFDKTGTLTKGVFNVTKVNAVNVSEDELMEYAAYAEANSNLYLNEKERNKLYHWKDILEEPAYREYFRTKTFVESWYHFLDTHRMFDAAIWQYFQWIDGKLFSALEADVMPFAYPTQEEIERMPRQETPEQTQERRTPEPGPALPKVKKEKSKAVKVLLYLAALAGTGIGGMILGIIAGTILG